MVWLCLNFADGSVRKKRKGGDKETRQTGQPAHDQLSFSRHLDVPIVIWDDALDGLGYFHNAQSQRRFLGVTAGCKFEANMSGP